MTDKLKVCNHCEMIIDKQFFEAHKEFHDLLSEGFRQIRTKSSEYEWRLLMERFENNRNKFQHLMSLEREKS